MALVNCPKCKSLVSNSDKLCSKCGYDFEKRRKRQKYLFYSIVIAIHIIGLIFSFFSPTRTVAGIIFILTLVIDFFAIFGAENKFLVLLSAIVCIIGIIIICNVAPYNPPEDGVTKAFNKNPNQWTEEDKENVDDFFEWQKKHYSD